MASIHLLNVKPGDCSVIRHNSGRVTVMDICGGNAPTPSTAPRGILQVLLEIEEANGGNFRMCERTTHPLDYMRRIGIRTIDRFILSHPDMDHMDGLRRLIDEFEVLNFWHTGATREPPPFGQGAPYDERDWLAYRALVAGNPGNVKVLQKLAGARFKYANVDDENGFNDGLHIVAPDPQLLNDPDPNDDVNEGSFVVSYNTDAGLFILPGDAHDEAWKYAVANRRDLVQDCSFLLAPHHGRDSGRSYDFLEVLRPKLTLIGCAPSEYIDYRQWHQRGLPIITSNQCGNVWLELHTGFYEVWVENERFARQQGANVAVRNQLGYVHLYTIRTR
jgi:beta-lactamase superfamily II metal-dependent hydrolase